MKRTLIGMRSHRIVAGLPRRENLTSTAESIMHELELLTNASCESNTSLACEENYEGYGGGRWFLEESSNYGNRVSGYR